MKKFLQSLLAKYMLIIIVALLLIQISFLFVATIFIQLTDSTEEVADTDEVEEQWHDEANELQHITEEGIRKHFAKWKEMYPEAGMFWVNEDGLLVEQLDPTEEYPSEWTANYTAKFIKERYGGEPFTVIAFIGEEKTNGFIVLELPRYTFLPPLQKSYDQYGTFLLLSVLLIIILFMIISYLFFRGIRKRLVYLQQAMTARDVDGLPLEITIKKQDEIGQLEQTFNQMVFELRESKKREQEEEQLRKELIANLSHDLRTPLTKINAQTYMLENEHLSLKASQALVTLRTSIKDIDQLIENLMSYTLLMASKYKLDRREIDVVRYVREMLATWYPVFEKEGFEIEVDLKPFTHNQWNVDPIWLKRIFDNLLQNVLRHAKSGRYVSVKTLSTDEYDAFVIMDKGKGMNDESEEKGVGIGLSIVDMMVKGMELNWEIRSNEYGTKIIIMRKHMKKA